MSWVYQRKTSKRHMGMLCEIHYSRKIITQKIWTSAERCGRDPSRKPTFVGMFEHHYSQITRKVHLAKNTSKMHF